MDGQDIESVLKATGLPEEIIKPVLKKWIMETGRSPQGMTLEDLREVLTVLIQNLFVDVADGQNPHINLLD